MTASRPCAGVSGSGGRCGHSTTHPSGRCPDHRNPVAATPALAVAGASIRLASVDPMAAPARPEVDWRVGEPVTGNIEWYGGEESYRDGPTGEDHIDDIREFLAVLPEQRLMEFAADGGDHIVYVDLTADERTQLVNRGLVEDVGGNADMEFTIVGSEVVAFLKANGWDL